MAATLLRGYDYLRRHEVPEHLSATASAARCATEIKRLSERTASGTARLKGLLTEVKS